MLITINTRLILKVLLVGILPLSAFLFFFFTGYHYIPVELSLGSCKMDNTSFSAYKERVTPMISNHFEIINGEILICYGSPSVRNRKIFGELVSYGSLWRLGANEPTRLYTNVDFVLGEVVIPKGRYSLYAIPHKDRWEIFISSSTLHWGNAITDKVRSKEIGSFEVETEYNTNYVEDFTILRDQDELIIEWEKTRVRIPIVSLEEEDSLLD